MYDLLLPFFYFTIFLLLFIEKICYYLNFILYLYIFLQGVLTTGIFSFPPKYNKLGKSHLFGQNGVLYV